MKKVSDIVAEIAAASREQSSGIEQVNRAVMQMDEMTQQNAALVEEATRRFAVHGGPGSRPQQDDEPLSHRRRPRRRPGWPRRPARQRAAAATAIAARKVERRSASRPWSKAPAAAAARRWNASADAGAHKKRGGSRLERFGLAGILGNVQMRNRQRAGTRARLRGSSVKVLADRNLFFKQALTVALLLVPLRFHDDLLRQG